MEKSCKTCKQVLSITSFYKNHKAPDGLAYSCKACSNKYVRAWAQKNREKAYQYQKSSRDKKPEHYKAKDIAWRTKNPKAAVEKSLRWAARNPGIKLAFNAKRRAQKLKATPPWANEEKIKKIYCLAALWNEIWPEDPVHVDHIYPLQGENVSGLHTENNLQLLRAKENIRKYNKLVDTSIGCVI